MAFHRGDPILVHFRALSGDAEGPVPAIAPGPPGDLADLLRMQPARAPPVELSEAGEGDMVEVHVQPHADRIGGDEKIDLAGLEQLHLGVAGARGQRAHHHRRAAALATDQFGDGVDRLGGERDHRAAPRQTRELLRAIVDQLGKALARADFGVRAQSTDQRRDGRGAQQHRLGLAARVQQALREDVTALAVRAELDFIDRQKLHLTIERHGLDRADEILRRPGYDLFLAGDQRDAARPARLDDAIVDLARQQP